MRTAPSAAREMTAATCRHGMDLSPYLGDAHGQIDPRDRWQPANQAVLDALRVLAPRASGRLLDVGCGHKPYAALFAPYVAEYIGVDSNTDDFDDTDADIVATGAEIPVESGSYETVLSTQTLEHVPDPWAMLRECARVLRPGGLLLLTCPFVQWMHCEPSDYFRFTPYGLRTLAEDAGLVVEEVRPLGGFWTFAAQSLGEYLESRAPQMPSVPRALHKLFRAVVRPALYRLAAWADRRNPDPHFALNHALIARKPLPRTAY